MKAVLAAVLVAFLCGCRRDSVQQWDTLDMWELHATLPAGTTPGQLMKVEADLRSNGYVRVLFRVATSGWTDTPLGTNVYATKRPKPERR